MAAVLLPAAASAQATIAAGAAAPLTIGETFTLESKVLGETRRINVYVPPVYGDSASTRMPVLYMPDGGIGEDFLHIAGLVQISVANGTMRPFILVGIENTQRRRDLTGPTQNPEDRTIAPQVGGSAGFRQFIRSELIPLVNARYKTTAERAIVGESLAGLFVVETFFLEPALFDTYIAFDPSLWWNNETLLNDAAVRLRSNRYGAKSLYLASSADKELSEPTSRLAEVFRANAQANVTWHHRPMPDETHATIYQPAALSAFRHLFKPRQDER